MRELAAFKAAQSIASVAWMGQLDLVQPLVGWAWVFTVPSQSLSHSFAWRSAAGDVVTA